MDEYHFGPLALHSDLVLPELCEIGPDSPKPSAIATIATDDAGLSSNFHPIHVDERSAYALMIDGTSGVATMRHEDAVDYVISPALDQVTVRATPATTASTCLLYTSPSPRDATLSRMPSSA